MALQSTVASIHNIRKQRQLELELVELDRKWHVELKVIARERLALVKELCRIKQDMRDMDHFRDTMHGKALTRFADKAQGRLLHDKEMKELHKFNFQPDPVEKMNLQLPLIREEGVEGEPGGDLGKVLTAKDLYKQRVQLRKFNTEQSTADRRSRRRPFWDKAIIGERKPKSFRDRNPSFRASREGMLEPTVPVPETEESEDEHPKPRALAKSPSLPALNKLRRSDAFRASAVHPSLSNRHSASMDYLPVIRSSRGQNGVLKMSNQASLSNVALPTITETVGAVRCD